MKKLIVIAVFAAFGLLAHSAVMAQGLPKSIKVSGIIVDGDSSYGVPGVHIYIPSANVGTVSNPVGYFSLPAMQGDTVVISYVGYKKQRLIVPETDDRGISLLIDLQTDTTFLPVIEVFPYPTEAIFKEAFLALRMPDPRLENMARNLDPVELSRMAAALPMDGSANHRFYMHQQSNQLATQMMAPTFSIMNPFAWAEFIRSVKRGDLKKKN